MSQQIDVSKLQQNSFSRTEYYTDAFGPALRYVWGNSPFALEIENLAHFRAIAVCAKKSPASIRNSRRMLYHYLTEFKKELPKDLINQYYKQLPVSNFFDKYTRNIGTNYNKPPRRTFGEKGEENDEFRPVYEEGHLNSRFREIEHLMLVMNIVAARPVIRNDKLALDILTPDLFRVETDPNDVQIAKAIWYPVIVSGQDSDLYKDQNPTTILRRWDAETIRDYDRGNFRTPIREEANPYGELPFVFFRLHQGDDFYGGGDIELVDLRMEANASRFYATLGIKYEGNGIAIGTNLGIKAGETITFGPGTLINRNDVVGDPESTLPPSLEFVSPNGQFDRIETTRRDRTHEGLRMRGIPNSNLIENPGTPASGAARVVERMELNDMREEAIEALMLGEAELKRKVGLVWNVDMPHEAALPVNETLGVGYEKEPIVMEPKDEYTLAMTLVTDYVIPVTDFINRFAGREQVMTDDEVVEYIQNNRDLYERAFKKQTLMPLPGPGKVAEPTGDPSAGMPDNGTTHLQAGQDNSPPSVAGNNQAAPSQKT